MLIIKRKQNNLRRLYSYFPNPVMFGESQKVKISGSQDAEKREESVSESIVCGSTIVDGAIIHLEIHRLSNSKSEPAYTGLWLWWMVPLYTGNP